MLAPLFIVLNSVSQTHCRCCYSSLIILTIVQVIVRIVSGYLWLFTVDLYESQWWLNTTKLGSSKWKTPFTRNRTKVYIYPSYKHFEDIELPRTTVRSITTNATTISDENAYVVLPGANCQKILAVYESYMIVNSANHKSCKLKFTFQGF